jgi:hypothetical protein
MLLYILMGYYAKFLEKMEKQKKELEELEELEKKDANRKNYLKYKHKEYHKKNYEKQKEYARNYYWKNREYVLERQRAKKYETSQYYKEWYNNNREQVNLIRYGKKPVISNIKPKLKKEPIKKKEYTAEDFILFK